MSNDDTFEREVRKVLDKTTGKDRDKNIKMLKTQYRDRTNQINEILKSYE